MRAHTTVIGDGGTGYVEGFLIGDGGSGCVEGWGGNGISEGFGGLKGTASA